MSDVVVMMADEEPRGTKRGFQGERHGFGDNKRLKTIEEIRHGDSEVDYFLQHEVKILRGFRNGSPEYSLLNHAFDELKCHDVDENRKNEILDYINSTIIESKMIEDNTELDCSNCHLTRFPDRLFRDPQKNHQYWRGLSALVLNNNNLRYVSEYIGFLEGLEGLDLSHNGLSHLPHSTTRLENLEYLFLDYNPWVDLPIGFRKDIFYNDYYKQIPRENIIFLDQKPSRVFTPARAVSVAAAAVEVNAQNEQDVFMQNVKQGWWN